MAPGSADTAYLGYGGTAGVNGSASCATLYVGSDQSFYPGSGTLNINAAANLSGVGTMYLGSNVSGYMGTVTQSGGAASVGTITFGGASAGMAGGTYNLNGGTLGVGSGGITLGTNGTAAMNLNGGTLQATATFSSSVPLTLTSTSTIDTPGSNTATFAVAFSVRRPEQDRRRHARPRHASRHAPSTFTGPTPATREFTEASWPSPPKTTPMPCTAVVWITTTMVGR